MRWVYSWKAQLNSDEALEEYWRNGSRACRYGRALHRSSRPLASNGHTSHTYHWIYFLAWLGRKFQLAFNYNIICTINLDPDSAKLFQQVDPVCQLNSSWIGNCTRDKRFFNISSFAVSFTLGKVCMIYYVMDANGLGYFSNGIGKYYCH